MCNEASEHGLGALEYQKHVAGDQVVPLGVPIRRRWK